MSNLFGAWQTNLSEKTKFIIAAHNGLANCLWFRQLDSSKLYIVFALVISIAAVSTNSFVRYSQYQSIQNSSVGETWLSDAFFSTADAPYFVKLAQIHHTGASVNSLERIRNYPNNLMKNRIENQVDRVTDFPLISVILSLTTSNSSPPNFIQTGNQILIVTAGLTALMIIICFGSIGYWLEGAVAAVGGGLSATYLIRSSSGRIDTDQLNLGFLYLLFGLAIFAAKAKSRTMVFFCVSLPA